jgi:hypothetical protein
LFAIGFAVRRYRLQLAGRRTPPKWDAVTHYAGAGRERPSGLRWRVLALFAHFACPVTRQKEIDARLDIVGGVL